MSVAAHHLTLKGTFIDIEQQEVDLSPRAHSDPGPSRRQDLFFEDQQKYIERLDEMYNYDSLATQEPVALGVASECGDHALRNYQLRAMTPLQTWQRSAAAAPREPAQEAGAPWLLGRRGGRENLAQDKKDGGYALGRAAALLTTYREEPDHHSDGPAGSDADAWSPRARQESGWPRHKLPGGVHAGFPLSALEGTWQVVEGSLCEEGLWTIEESGRALFNGKHFGADYDVYVRCPEGGVALVQRGDGWTVDLQSSSVDRLVWRKAGETVRITWVRATLGPLEAEAAEAASPCRENKRELWSKMQASAQQMRQGWSCEGRLANAIAVMEDAVFKRICEDMQRAASFIVDNMQAEVSAMRREIRKDMCVGDLAIVDGAATADKVITNLEVIPTMVQNLLEARVARARDKVRRYVQGMTQEMSENAQDNKWLVARMQQIPKEAVQMAGDAVATAAKECEAHAFKQLEVALSALQERDEKGALGLLAKRHQSAWAAIQGDDGSRGCVAWEVGHDPWRLSRTVAQAIAVVQNQDNIPQSITNQVVADELLRARIRSGGAGDKRATVSGVQSRGAAAVAPKPSPVVVGATNPGSRGHPDLCRPCLFNAQGICSKGESCAFCHVPHPKRPVRFDKLHRETLKRMSFRYLAGIMLPVLQQKCDNAELRSNPEALELLASLWPHLERHAAQQQAAGDGADRAAVAVERGQQRRGVAEDAAAGGSECGAADADGGEGEVAGVPSMGSAAGGGGAGEARILRKEGSFASVLQVMALRSLLATLVSKVPEEDPELRNLVEAILQRLQGQRPGPPAAAAPGTAAPPGLRRGIGRGRRGGAGRQGPAAVAPSCEEVPMGSLVTRRLVGVGGD